MNIQSFAIRRPIATLTILLIVVVIGVVSLSRTPLDLLPDIQPPVLAILTVFPGTSPQETMTLVAAPMEEQLAVIGGLTNIRSISQEGMALVILQFNWGTDIKAVRAEVETRLDFLPLPDGAQRPLIVEFDPTLLPVMELAVSGQQDPVTLTRRLRETVVPRLETLPGVASAQVVGGTKEDVFVRLAPGLLEKYQLSFDQVAGILGGSLLDLPGGIVEVDGRQLRLRFLAYSHALEQLQDMVVGFVVDEDLLHSQLQQNINIDLNRMLAEAIGQPPQADIPMRTVYVRDLLRNFELGEGGELWLDFDPESLKRWGISPGDLVASLPGQIELPAEGDFRQGVWLDQVDWEQVLDTPVAEVPDFETWYANLRRQVQQELDSASAKLEQTLVEMAMAMLVSGQGGAIPGLAEDFPLQPVTLRAVASLERAPHPPETITRVNGLPSVSLFVQKEGSANTVQVARVVREELALMGEDYPDINFHYLYDQAYEIEEALADLRNALLGGAALAVVVLLLFLKDYRTLLFIATAIPVSVFFTFTLLYFANLTINIMTLGGLALAAGLLVDNAIVVSENIYRHLQIGETPAQAALKGSREIAGAILASTLTTVCVFFPIVFISGLAAELFRDFALTVASALAASLIVSLTLIPLLAARFLRPGAKLPGALRIDLYRRILTYVLRRPWVPLVAALLVVVAGAIGFTQMGSDLFPVTAESSFTIDVSLPPGTPLTETDAFVADLEEVLGKCDEVEFFSARVGAAQFYGFAAEGGVANQARFRVRVKPEHAGEIEQLMARVRAETNALREDAQLFFARESLLNTAGMDSRLELVISGDDRQQITAVGEEVVATLAELPFLGDIHFTLEESRPEISVSLNHARALQYGLSSYQVANTLRWALEGMPVARVHIGEDIFSLILTYDRGALATLDDYANLGFYSPRGSWLRLGDVAEFNQSYGPASITRQNRRITGEVHAQYDGVNLGAAAQQALVALQDIELPAGVEIQTAGAYSLLGDVLGELEVVLIVSALLVYLVMAAQFESFRNPLIIISSLPIAYAGSIGALLLTGNSISVPALIGGVVLAGVLVNDGIIMVDLVNQHRQQGLPLQQAIVEGATARLRPVLMITITTILGVLPLALGLGAGSQLQAPMAIVIIGGQVVGTLLLLVVIPVTYQLLNRPWLRGKAK